MMGVAAYSVYESYKDSGIDWIGELPAHWAVHRSKFLFSQSKELARADDIQLSATQSHGVIPQVEYQDIVGRKVTQILSNLEKRKHVEIDDFVISMRSFQGGIERAKAVGCIRSSYIILKPGPDVHPAFYAYVLKAPRYIQALQNTGHFIRDGQDLNFENFSDVDLFVVPLPEQRAIAAFLDEKCAKIDAAVKIKEDQIALLRERRQIIIQEAVTRGLNPAASMKDSGIDWIGQIPGHWEVKPLMGISDVIDPNPSHRNPEYVEEGLPFISTQEFYGVDKIEMDTPRRVSEKTVAEQEARCRFQNGSLVFSRKGTIGAVRVLPVGVRLGILDSLCVVNPRGLVLPDFLFWTLTANYLEAQYGSILRGAALPQLSVGRVRSLKIILPPELEQREIADFLRNECQRLNEGIAIKERQIAAFKEHKTSLINAAVTGKIKVI